MLENNIILHKLLNKTGSSTSQFFPFDKNFEDKGQSKDWLDLQKRLYLHIPEEKTPLFIYKALTILESFPRLKETLGYDKTTYKLVDFVPKSEYNYLIKFWDEGNVIGKMKSSTSIFPLDIDYRLSLDSKSLIVVTPNRESAIPILSLIKENNLTYIQADWGDILPIEGRLVFFGNWAENLFVDFTYVPPRLDFDAWLSYVTASASHNAIINQAGTTVQFNLCDTADEKLAILIASLIKTHNG